MDPCVHRVCVFSFRILHRINLCAVAHSFTRMSSLLFYLSLCEMHFQVTKQEDGGEMGRGSTKRRNANSRLCSVGVTWFNSRFHVALPSLAAHLAKMPGLCEKAPD